MFRLNPFSFPVQAILALFLALLTLIGGCSPSNQPSAKGCNKIAILLPETGPAARWELSDRPELERRIAQKLIKNNNVKDLTLLYFNANGDPQKQFQQANRAIEQGACLLILGPSSSSDATEIVKKASEKQIPVIAYDRAIDNGNIYADYYISFDSKYVGQKQGEYIKDQFVNLDNKNHRYELKPDGNKFVMINGDKNDPNSKLLAEGLKSILQTEYIDTNRLNLVEETNIQGWDAEKAADKIQEVLTKYSEIKIAWVANDGMANKIIEKLVKLGYKPDQILITGQDGTDGSIDKIADQWQSMTVCKDSNDLAEKTALLVEALFQGKTEIPNTKFEKLDFTKSKSLISKAIYSVNLENSGVPPVTPDSSNDQVSIDKKNKIEKLKKTCSPQNPSQ
ncbi:substrate-binding domain-containing protein [Planktothrix sp. FACHB-1365]|uniref:substrate-binding domain-containing protein n=1 Tax=Planktothrix sp. FACHB-1365 TaxID=2692855 RepID=UPI0016882344|nr:substrate-binding domain-containing protein [Planktothrix sp. FACHB-1365]MBD2480985.1 substrate-binding domain-containing protein [Planktothrix sp. FACHB-1365]